MKLASSLHDVVQLSFLYRSILLFPGLGAAASSLEELHKGNDGGASP